MRALFIAFALALPAAPASAVDAGALWDSLRQGGRVALIRHAEAPGGAGDPAGFRLDDCATQRNLSERGRRAAAELGARIRTQRVPVARVLTSQWCRCRETARLMDLGEPVEAPTFNNAFAQRTPREDLERGARDLIAGWRGPGTLIVVTHGANILELTAIHPAQAAIVVVEPQPAAPDRLRVLGRIDPPG
ncbi:MAG: histidine phosphatase family protein [Pseudorhodoplanes sp.]|nr:histidine phosphatase family protein [Pseudorhodoplanes sp.]